MRKSSCLYKTGVEAECIDGARSAKPEEKTHVSEETYVLSLIHI